MSYAVFNMLIFIFLKKGWRVGYSYLLKRRVYKSWLSKKNNIFHRWWIGVRRLHYWKGCPLEMEFWVVDLYFIENHLAEPRFFWHIWVRRRQIFQNMVIYSCVYERRNLKNLFKSPFSRMFEVKCGLLFILRCTMKRHMFIFIVVTLSVVILVFGHAVKTAEK